MKTQQVYELEIRLTGKGTHRLLFQSIPTNEECRAILTDAIDQIEVDVVALDVPPRAIGRRDSCPQATQRNKLRTRQADLGNIVELLNATTGFPCPGPWGIVNVNVAGTPIGSLELRTVEIFENSPSSVMS